MKVFELNELEFDKNKKNILFFTNGRIDKYSHIFGPQRYLINKLKENYNVFIIGTINQKNLKNYIKLNIKYSDFLKRKKDDPENYLKYNLDLLTKTIKNDLKDLPFFDFVISENDTTFMMPLSKIAKDKDLQPLLNEYFDYVGNDEDYIKKIEKENERIKDLEVFMYVCSPLAFLLKKKSIFMLTVKILNDVKKIGKFIGFVQDPTYFTPFFKVHNIPSKFVYFVIDKRGTRNFEEFPIAQFQYNVYEKEFFNKTSEDYKKERSDEKRIKNLLFAGTILQEKGERSKAFDRFLNDVKSEKCEYYIPLKKGSLNVATKKSKLKKFEEENLKLIEKIQNHKNYKGQVSPEELNEKFKEFKYGLCLKPVSHYDSLSFKSINYVNVGILPLLEKMYDPDYLQIPKEIQDKIVINSAEDIDERIKYFNDNPEERKEILQKLRELFKLDDFIINKNNIIEESINKLLQ